MNLGYLDAGTGSLIIQTLLGGTAGLIVFFKTSGRRFFVRKNKSAQATEAQTTTEADGLAEAAPAEQTTEL